ncbi:MAG TPA: ABC transporter ATP-binding protein [Candidatus Omnitrophota bacterium]|nr:ABC transporter ATP-binding protein [Candidatus Omnitrophota bacterium]HOX09832.1 ABC transporter ATP-binding protein [Candidatus Omnitrophota bacterium]
MNDMIEAKGLRKVYRNGTRQLEVLKGVDIKAGKGEVLALLGPSGAGKSTLLHLLGGLDAPTDGEVRFGGKDIFSLSDSERAKIRNEKIGFIFQFYHLLPEFDAVENVMLPALIAGKARGKARSAAEELIAAVGLADRMRHKPGQLSGGEQQRVAIARALTNEPELLLCDEPTGNLDSDTGRNIIELLWELNKKRKMTMIIVTHDAGIAEEARRVVRIKDGVIV